MFDNCAKLSYIGIQRNTEHAMRNKKEERINARIDETEKAQLDEISERLDIPVSQIVRDGVRREVAILRERVNRESALQN